jgi:uncharacterized protein YciI
MKKYLSLLIFLVSSSSIYAQDNKYVFVFLHKRSDLPERPKEEVDKLMKGHLENINRLAKEGKLLVAGPFDEGGGIFILKAATSAEAEALLASDPGVQQQRWKIEYLPIAFRIGGACPVGEKYEMTDYHFIRYQLNLTKFNVKESPNTFKKHEQYMQTLAHTGNVVAEATFGNNEGSVLIMKGELDTRVVEASPAVQEQLYEIDIKKLWVAKGSFCEK